MEQDLKQYLENMEARIVSTLKTHVENVENRVVSTLKAHVENVENRVVSTLKAHVENVENRVVSTLKAHVSEECESVETKLLAEFWKWGQGNDRKMRRVEFSDATTVERMAILEERVFTLERKAAGSKE